MAGLEIRADGKLSMRLAILAMGLLMVGRQAQSQMANANGRRYWNVSIDSLAAGRVKHPHVAIEGRILFKRWEDDGDLHLRIAGPHSFIVAECIPSCGNCKALEAAGLFTLGKRVRLLGIPRYDREHRWYELHPIERVIPVKP